MAIVVVVNLIYIPPTSQETRIQWRSEMNFTQHACQDQTQVLGRPSSHEADILQLSHEVN